MKNFFLFSFGIVLSAGLGMAVSTSAFTSDEDLLESLFSQAGVTKTYNNDSKELKNLAGDELPFQHLYLFMLQNVMNGPQEAALKALSEQYLGANGKFGVKYSTEELSSIVLEGNTEVIVNAFEKELSKRKATSTEAQQDAAAQADADMQEFLDSNEFSASTQAYLQWKYEQETQPQKYDPNDLNAVLTNEGIFKEFTFIVNLYEQELEFQTDNRKLAYESLASEMFYNHEPSDSANIDILYDLDLVHYLLFGEYITYPDRSGEEPVVLTSETPVDLASETFDPSQELNIEKAIRSLADEAVTLAEESGGSESVESVDPYTCWESDEVVAALEEYEENPPETGDVPEEETTFDYDVGEEEEEEEEEESRTTEGEVAEESQVEAEEKVDVGAAMQELDGFITALEGTVGDWTRSLPCNDLFCITLELVTENDDPTVEYEKTDHCIACHVAYISKRMEETTSKSLVPSKISMNWFEDATCKQAGNFVNLDLNIYAIAKPIDLDPGDDIDTAAEKDIEETKTLLWGNEGIPIPGGENKGEKTALGKTLGDRVCKAILNLNEIGDFSRPLDEMLGECQDAADQIAADKNRVFEEFVFESSAQNSQTLYGQVSAELYTMLIQFMNFQEGLKASYESDDAPLTSLISKPYCQ